MGCIVAIGRNPGSNDWICATSCKDERADDTGIRIEIRLLFPFPAAAKSEPQHPNGYGESKDGDDSIGVEINENCISTRGVKMDRHKDHDNSEAPVEEEGSKGCLLRVLFGVHPWLLKQPVEVVLDESMLIAFDSSQEASKGQILRLGEEFSFWKNSFFGNFLLHYIQKSTGIQRRSILLERHSPRAAVKVMTTILPKLEMAMNADRIRSGRSSFFDKVPNVDLKNKRATLLDGLS